MAIKAFVFLYVLLNYAVLNGHASITASELSVRSSMAASGAVLWVKVKNGNCLVTCTKFADMQPVGAGKGPNEEFPSLVCGVKNPTTGSLIAGWTSPPKPKGRAPCFANDKTESDYYCGCLPKRNFWQWKRAPNACDAGYTLPPPTADGLVPHICRYADKDGTVFIGQGQQDKTAFPYDCIFYDGSAVKAVTDFDGFDRLCVRKTFEYMCSDIDTVAVD